MKKIAVDAMGGDNAPQALVEGVNQAIRDFDDIEIVLYGDETKIKDYLTATERVSIVHTEEKIDSDDEPTRAIRRKKQASMVLAAKDVKVGEVDAMLSAGNTGALLAAGFFIVGRIKGVERPGLMSTLPTVDGRGYDMLDLGANAENTPEHLHQYAVMGSYYAENVRGIQKPRVGLLNNGTEASKGDPLRKETYQLLSEDASIHFVGWRCRCRCGGWFHGKRCLENDGRNSFWNLEAIETSNCYWKLEGETRSFSPQGPVEIIETNLGFLRCWRSGFIWPSSTCC